MKYLTLRNSYLGFVLLTLGTANISSGLEHGKSITQYAHRIWGQEEGLFQPTIYSIVQTHDGFLWLGTQDSLIRFDGVHFREFAGGDSVLGRALIRSLAEDKDGNLWAGSPGGGVIRVSPSGEIKHYSTQNGLPSDTVFFVTADRNGAVWVCTSEGLARIDADGIRVFTTAEGLPSNKIRNTCQAADGTRWVAGMDFGLSRWTGSRFVTYSDRHLRGENISALQCGTGGGIWVGTSAGVTHIEEGSSRSYTSANGLPDDDVSALAEGSDGTLWIGTDQGVSRLRNGDISVYRVRDGLSHGQVLALCLDREGTLWAGTKNGLDQFTDGNVTPYTTNEGLLSNDVGPVLEDKDGKLWIGTLGKGLDSYDGRRFHALTRRDGLVSNTILSLALDPSGDLWVGMKGGLNRIRSGHVVATYSTENGLRGNETRSLFVDRSGTLWVGTEAGLDRLSGNRLTPAPPLTSDSRKAVMAIGGDDRIRLVAGLDETGLYLLRTNGPSLFPLAITHPVDNFLFDRAHHAIWMGTAGSGLLRWKAGSLARVFVKDGLYDNRIYSILQDDSSNFWLASSKGIFRLSHQELDDFADGRRKTVTSLPFTTGQLRFECRAGVQPAAFRTADGRLWFSTTSGLVVIDPNHLQRNQVAPPVQVTSLLVNGQQLRSSGEPHLKPWETNNLEIRYAGLSFVSPEKVTFRYKLQGNDPNWIDAGTRREAFYTNLPPGNFDFRVQARNADGVWSKQASSLPFIVDPRLHQRWWFFPALAIALGLSIFAGFRLRLRHLRRRFDLVLAERNRIARELHDTLLQGLSGITMQLQALWSRLPASRERQILADIIHDAGRCSSEARQSLWGLRSAGPGSPEFSRKLTNLARHSVAGKRLALSLAIDSVSLHDRPDAEYQLLRIAQEAISNTLQHAEALRLTIALKVDQAFLQLVVEDDGVGIPGSHEPRWGHFGLKGIEERAREIGAALSVTSSPATGTRISVVMPLKSGSGQVVGNPGPLAEHQMK